VERFNLLQELIRHPIFWRGINRPLLLKRFKAFFISKKAMYSGVFFVHDIFPGVGQAKRKACRSWNVLPSISALRFQVYTGSGNLQSV